MGEHVTLTLDEVHKTALEILKAQGFNDAHAQAIAKTVTAAERDGSSHHGLFRLLFYAKGLRSGLASGSAEPEVSRIAPAVVRVDAKYAFAPLALEVGEEPVAELAAE